MTPEWAAVLGQNEYQLFVSALDGYFKSKGRSYVIGDGFVQLEENDWQFGLINLVQVCAKIKPEDYPKFIENHFNSIIEIRAFEESLDFGDFEKMKQYIGVRLYDKEYIAATGQDAFIRRPFAGEVFSTLVYDFPRAVKNISNDNVNKWGKTEDELFAIGIENIRRNYEFNIQKVQLNEDAIFVVETDHFFAPNILFELEQHIELVGKGGAIIGIPLRNMVMIYPIRDMKVLEALRVFFDSIPKFYAKGPGSLTREIYWYFNGQYESLNYEPGERVQFTPSQAFLELLNEKL